MTAQPHKVAGEHLLAFVQRIERMHEEKKEIEDDLRDIYKEAKTTGFDTKAIKDIVKLRRRDPDEVQEADAIISTYLRAIEEAEGRADSRARNPYRSGTSAASSPNGRHDDTASEASASQPI